MTDFRTELFIANRLNASRGGDSRGVMVRVAAATTALSIAVMIIAVAVIMGFRSQISGKIVGFGGALKISALDYSRQLESRPIAVNPELERDIAGIPGFHSISPYAFKGGLIRTDRATQGVMLKGVGPGSDLSFFRENLVEGDLPRLADTVRHKDILISKAVAGMLSLGVDDRVEMLFAYPDRSPRRDRFRVSGIYSSGIDELDRRFVLTDITNVQRLNGWGPESITGYEIAVDDLRRLEGFEKEAYVRTLEHDEGDPPLMLRSIYDENPQMFDWLKTHDINAAVIIGVMLAVSLLSMISALLIILLEHTSTIGILKALGMKNRSVRGIFLIRSAYIVLTGLVAGNIAGIGLALIQKYTGAVTLNESGYFLSTVPIDLGWQWIAALNVGTLAVILTLLMLPAGIISRITPEKTIRYQ